MKVHYLVQRQADIDATRQWLGPDEATYLDSLRFPKRIDDYRLSRWTAKAALTRTGIAPDSSLADWQIVPARSGAPMLLLRGQPDGTALSLSHSGDVGLCVTSPANLRLGCDIETVEPRTFTFADTYFTSAEVGMLAAAFDEDSTAGDRWWDEVPAERRDRLVTLFWSAKEAALKVLQVGLRADTRRVRIEGYGPDCSGAWRPLVLWDQQQDIRFTGWWRDHGKRVITVLGDQPIDIPLPL